jgi:hypothetical protein
LNLRLARRPKQERQKYFQQDEENKEKKQRHGAMRESKSQQSVDITGFWSGEGGIPIMSHERAAINGLSFAFPYFKFDSHKPNNPTAFAVIQAFSVATISAQSISSGRFSYTHIVPGCPEVLTGLTRQQINTLKYHITMMYNVSAINIKKAGAFLWHKQI